MRALYSPKCRLHTRRPASSGAALLPHVCLCRVDITAGTMEAASAAVTAWSNLQPLISPYSLHQQQTLMLLCYILPACPLLHEPCPACWPCFMPVWLQRALCSTVLGGLGGHVEDCPLDKHSCSNTRGRTEHLTTGILDSFDGLHSQLQVRCCACTCQWHC